MKSPTQITPIGLLGNDRGGRINLRDYALPILANIGSQPPTTIDVVGTGMDSGKTAVEKQCGFNYEVQHGLKIHETPGAGF